MTDKARELLERALEELIEQNLDLQSEFYTGGEWEEPKVIEEIRAYLAEPKKKRERLSDAFIYQVGNRRVIAEFNDEFHAGVRFAEKHHGIGGGDE